MVAMNNNNEDDDDKINNIKIAAVAAADAHCFVQKLRPRC